MEFTERELTVIDLALTHLRRHYKQLAVDFRREPVAENIAQAYDKDAARTTALLGRVRAAIAKAEGR